jgi:formate hydrogenlyase subunit 3/multisubunit Na+/H+ antiporter MnhD subunit
MPPFGLFVSELMIFGGGFQQGYRLVPLLALGLLLVAFGGMLRAGHRMLYARAAAGETSSVLAVADGRDGLGLPVVASLTLLIVTGLAWPPGLASVLEHIASLVGR